MLRNYFIKKIKLFSVSCTFIYENNNKKLVTFLIKELCNNDYTIPTGFENLSFLNVLIFNFTFQLFQYTIFWNKLQL